VSTGIASGSAAADRAGLIRVEEVALTEVITPPPIVKKASSGEVIATNASSNPPGQEDPGVVAAKTTEEASARVETSDSSELAAPSMQIVVSSLGTRTGAAASPLLFGVASGSDKALQGPLIARAAGSEHDEAPPAPDTTATDAPAEKTSVATAGSGAGSLSSASQLQQEWADTASSAEDGGKP
jgi:hypothetical protein